MTQYIDLPNPSPTATLDAMRALVMQAQDDLELRKLWERIVAEVRQKDYLSEAAAVLNWVRLHIRYSRDPRTIEQVKSPRYLIRSGTGDCDDMATLIAALVGIGGATARFKAGAFRRSEDGRPLLAHVWTEVYEPSRKAWIALDPVPGRDVQRMLSRVQFTVVAPAID